MDAITVLTKHLDIDRLLKHYEFDNLQDEGNFIRASCKLHNGDNPTAFVISRETGLWYCHTQCGGGDVYTLVQRMEGVEFKDSVHWLADFFDVDISDLHIKERQLKYVEELRNFIKLMKGKKKKQFEPFTIDAEIKEVTKYRNFNAETLKHFNLGYVDEVTLKKRSGEHFVLRQRLVFPIVFNNMQIGISFRRVRSSDVPKWLHQPVNFEIGDILYNYDSVKDCPVITISEGITDVWAWHEISVPAVATLGAHITQEQYKLLLRTGADLIFAFDGDMAGQLITKRATKMFKHKANIYVVPFSDEEDPESISREELKERYDRKEKL